MHTKFIAIVLLLSAQLFAQTPFRVEYSRIDGELTQSDLFKKDFGRYDGYSVPMTEGEVANFFLYSESFSPLLVLITPDEKIYYQSPIHDTEVASFYFDVPITGEWIVYVLGNEKSFGKYYLQYGFASENSLKIDKGWDLCTQLDFVLEHSNAYFIFLEITARGKNLFRIDNSIDSYINGDDATYNAVFFDGNNRLAGEDVYLKTIEEIQKCMSGKWISRTKDWDESTGIKEKYFEFAESKRSDPRFVRILFYDYADIEDEYQNDYVVTLTVGK